MGKVRLVVYNNERTHQGKGYLGRIPMQPLLDSKELVKQNDLAAMNAGTQKLSGQGDPLST